ncbi:MAG: hypothetical protein IJ925_06470, partial [Muribaculaceae bacterium]|nr:hypothetical protein [Muribaculaceae bacterium]
TTQFAIDAVTHYVYFGFRAATTEKNYTTGLKYFDPVQKKVVDFNGNRERILGLCVNPRNTYLF